MSQQRAVRDRQELGRITTVSMSGGSAEKKDLERSISHSSMETDAAPQRSRGSNQRIPPTEHNVQLPDVPYDEASHAVLIGAVEAYSYVTTSCRIALFL